MRWRGLALPVPAPLLGIAVMAAAQEASPSASRLNTVGVTKRVYDTQKLASTTVPDNIYRGRAIWLQRCAYCHDGVGQPSYHTLGPWIGAETIDNLTEAGVRQFTAMGTQNMPGFQYTLNAGQMTDLISFIRTISADQKPTPNQLAGKGPGEAQGD